MSVKSFWKQLWTVGWPIASEAINEETEVSPIMCALAGVAVRLEAQQRLAKRPDLTVLAPLMSLVKLSKTEQAVLLKVLAKLSNAVEVRHIGKV